MAPGQNTFSIIPNAPGAINGDSDASQSRLNKRPMTTKQAKKAYQKANKGPKLSKAERRRQELFEQDRIRKEFEKEKNQARAKAARDRKREKEEKERAEKKKKGLPLVDVHPSQDTIAWFVRGNGRKRQDNSVESLPAVNKDDNDDRNSRTSSSDENETEPPPKRQRTESPGPMGTNPDADADADADPDHSPCPAGVIGDSMSAAQSVQDLDAGEVPPSPEVIDSLDKHPSTEHANIDVDEPETVESLPDELFNELIDATIASSKDEATVPDIDLGRPSSRNQNPPDSYPSPKPTKNCPQSPSLIGDLPLEQKAEDSASLPPVQRPLQILSPTKVNSRASNTPGEPTPGHGKLAVPRNTALMNSSAQAPRRAQPAVPTLRSFHPQTPMGPPPVPAKFKPRSHLPSRDPRTPPFLTKQTQTPNSHVVTKPQSRPKLHRGYAHEIMQEELPPTSTQLFMLGHLDDFFPSPSQEVRELFEEPKLSIEKSSALKTKTTYQTHSSPTKNLPSTRSTSNASNLNLFVPTAKNGEPKPTHFQNYGIPAHASNHPSISVANAQSSGISETFDMPFFSTQDFVLSSQDMRDLEDETPSPSGFKPRGQTLQSINATVDSGLPLVNVTQRDTTNTAAYSATTSSSSRKQDHGLRLISRTVSTRGVHQVASPCPPVGAVECPKGLTPVCKDVASLNPQTGKGTKPLERTKQGVLPASNQSHRNKTSSVLRINNDVAKPNGSPNPFFASSGREAHYKYVIERSKTALWEDASTRQKARKELEHFQRSEDERSEKLLTGHMTESEDTHAINNRASSSESESRNSNPKPETQPKSQSQPRSINQLSGLAEKGAESKKAEEPVEKRPRQNNSRSSYEEMLEMLKRKEAQKQAQQAMSASQETDYGEAGLDDVLCEML